MLGQPVGFTFETLLPLTVPVLSRHFLLVYPPQVLAQPPCEEKHPKLRDRRPSVGRNGKEVLEEACTALIVECLKKLVERSILSNRLDDGVDKVRLLR